MDISTKNASRFTGFSDVYDEARPRMPQYPTEIITRYLGKRPELVVDLGCGTGLSTLAWKSRSAAVIGIEPNDDMRAAANKKAGGTVSFKKAFAHDTGLRDNCADAVVCSQSFHWMNPGLTLAEVNRILKPGGIFATVDYDWPPVCAWEGEAAYARLFFEVDRLQEADDELKDASVRWEKSGHMDNIKNSGHFRYCREILFANRETCTAQRFIGMAMSQGGLQSVLRRMPERIEGALNEYRKTVRRLFADETFEMDICYRMRLGVK